MRRANLRRAEEASLNLAAQAEKVSSDPLRAPLGEHAPHVLDEDEERAALDEQAPGRSPQVSRVIAAETLSGEAVRLARDAANDAVHEATEASAREGSHIRVDSCRSQETLLNRFDQTAGGEGFPLHHSDCASAWDCQLDAEVEPSASGADADEVERVVGT